MKRQSLATTSVSVFIQTNPFSRYSSCISLSKTIGMSVPVSDESILIPLVSKTLEKMYESGYQFYKGGVMLSNLTPDKSQQDLFTQESKTSKFYSQHPYGNLIQYASELGNNKWRSKADFISDRYTTNWNELLSI